VFYLGSFFALFNPFALLCGLLSVSMLVLHGSGWLVLKVEPGPVQSRARTFGLLAAPASLVLFAVGGAWVAWGDVGFRITGTTDPFGPSNPLRTVVEAAPGAWLDNYRLAPATLLAPAAGLLGSLLALLGNRWHRQRLAFAGSALGCAGIIATVGVSMFPFILPSSADVHSSLTVWNASSTRHTLGIMLLVVVVFLPLVLGYTAWALRVMRGRVTSHEIGINPDLY
ncbi:MAG: cytochrome d ubiquinol oxidase subunit II, partial [Proteobacteria bacterium]